MSECYDCKYCGENDCTHPNWMYCRRNELWTPKWYEAKVVVDDLDELINAIDSCSTPYPPYFFPRKWMLEIAIEFYNDTEIIIVDLQTGDMWQRGKKLKEKYGDNDGR